MSDTDTPAPTNDEYLSDDVQAVAKYRSVSGLAVTAGLLGILSLLSLIHLGFLLVALAAVAFAALALRRIDKSEGRLIGRNAALAGLALALAVSAGVIVHARVIGSMLSTEASQWGIDWCQLVMDGETVTALELKNPPKLRRPFDQSLTEYYNTNQAAAEQLTEFETDEVIQVLSTAPPGSTVEAGKLQDTQAESRGRYMVIHDFILLKPDGTRVGVRLQLRRQQVGAVGGNAWYVSNHVLVE